jgi:hypothetical protein
MNLNYTICVRIFAMQDAFITFKDATYTRCKFKAIFLTHISALFSPHMKNKLLQGELKP